MSQHLEFQLKKAAARLVTAQKVTVLTGAGISVASGIRPFRGKGGLWEKYDPEVVVNINNFRRAPGESWVMLKEVAEVVMAAKPNPAHHAITAMQEMGLVHCVITQNVDGLHQKAGSREREQGSGRISR